MIDTTIIVVGVCTFISGYLVGRLTKMRSNSLLPTFISILDRIKEYAIKGDLQSILFFINDVMSVKGNSNEIKRK